MADGRESIGYFLSRIFPLPVLSNNGSKIWKQLTLNTVNDQRTARVAELLSDFRTLQYYIAGAPVDPPDQGDYYTEGWAALRQCSIDGQHILNCAAETRVPNVRGGPEEQAKAELQQYASPVVQLRILCSFSLGFCSMLIQDDMKHRRSIFVKLLRSDGLDGESQSCKAKDPTQAIRSS